MRERLLIREPLWTKALRNKQREQLGSNHLENRATGTQVEADHMRHKHSPEKRRNGGTPVGYSGRASLRTDQLPYSLKAINVELQQPAVTMQQPVCNNIGIGFPVRSMPITAHGTLEYVSATAKQQLHHNRGKMFSVQSLPRCYKQDS
jgi:hypothetical protein